MASPGSSSPFLEQTERYRLDAPPAAPSLASMAPAPLPAAAAGVRTPTLKFPQPASPSAAPEPSPVLRTPTTPLHELLAAESSFATPKTPAPTAPGAAGPYAVPPGQAQGPLGNAGDDPFAALDLGAGSPPITASPTPPVWYPNPAPRSPEQGPPTGVLGVPQERPREAWQVQQVQQAAVSPADDEDELPVVTGVTVEEDDF